MGLLAPINHWKVGRGASTVAHFAAVRSPEGRQHAQPSPLSFLARLAMCKPHKRKGAGRAVKDPVGRGAETREAHTSQSAVSRRRDMTVYCVNCDHPVSEHDEAGCHVYGAFDDCTCPGLLAEEVSDNLSRCVSAAHVVHRCAVRHS
jgi:hypothetical protein